MKEHPPWASLFLAGLSLLLLTRFARLPKFRHQARSQPRSQSAEQIDQVWQKANAKFDPERKALLAEVDRIARGRTLPCRLGIAAQL